jgi:hypothetical protein
MESTTYRSYPQNPQMPVDNSAIFGWGGGGGLGRSKLWEHPPHRKSENRKRGNAPLSRYEKKGVGGFHKAGFGRKSTTKNSHDADTLTTNTTEDCVGFTSIQSEQSSCVLVLAQGALIPQQDNHRGYKFQLLCANADNSSILTTILL